MQQGSKIGDQVLESEIKEAERVERRLLGLKYIDGVLHQEYSVFRQKGGNCSSEHECKPVPAEITTGIRDH